MIIHPTFILLKRDSKAYYFLSLSASFLFELSDSPLIVLLFDTELMTITFWIPDNMKAFHCSMAAHASLLSLNYSFKPM